MQRMLHIKVGRLAVLSMLLLIGLTLVMDHGKVLASGSPSLTVASPTVPIDYNSCGTVMVTGAGFTPSGATANNVTFTAEGAGSLNGTVRISIPVSPQKFAIPIGGDFSIPITACPEKYLPGFVILTATDDATGQQTTAYFDVRATSPVISLLIPQYPTVDAYGCETITVIGKGFTPSGAGPSYVDFIALEDGIRALSIKPGRITAPIGGNIAVVAHVCGLHKGRDLYLFASDDAAGSYSNVINTPVQ